LLFAEFILGLAEGEARGLAMTQVWLPTNPTNSGPAMPTYTALVTLLAVALYFFIATRVAAARVKFGVKLPATSGHPDFERVFRVHQNMLEWTPTFLVPLWLCAIYLHRVFRGLPPGGREEVARLPHPVHRLPAVVHRSGRRRRHASRGRVKDAVLDRASLPGYITGYRKARR
jgi:hypothetical protein